MPVTLQKPAATDVQPSPTPAPANMQFTHFGVLNAGQQSRTSLFTSITVNVLLALVVIIIGAAAKKTMDKRDRLTTLTEPIPIKKIEPVKPKVLPKPLPPTPKIKVEPPKIKLPDQVKLPDPPKLPEVKMTQPTPVITPAPPKQVTPPPAPKVVNLGRAMPATVVATNHPSAVALGQQTNPIAPSNRPATSAINLGQRGMAGMPASNTGAGATKVSLGSGSPTSTDMAGNGTRAVQGVKLGVAGGTGPMNATGKVAGPVNLGQVQQATLPKPAAPTVASAKSGPKVLFKPKPEYTAEAIKMHLEGVVAVRLKVTADGGVQVMGVTSGLGHGLDEAAVRAVQGTRFKPATDATGAPVEWEGVVNVAFQLAG
jgi:protein TonB